MNKGNGDFKTSGPCETLPIYFEDSYAKHSLLLLLVYQFFHISLVADESREIVLIMDCGFLLDHRS